MKDYKSFKGGDGYEIVLMERDEQLEKIVTIVKNNIEKISIDPKIVTQTTKTDLVIPTITGGSGIGKVTVLFLYISLDNTLIDKTWKRGCYRII